MVTDCKEARGRKHSLKCSVGELKFETELAQSWLDLVRRRSHTIGARRQIIFIGALSLGWLDQQEEVTVLNYNTQTYTQTHTYTQIHHTVRAHTHAHARSHTTQTHGNASKPAHIHTRTHTNEARSRTQPNTQKHTHTNTHKYVYVYTYVLIHSDKGPTNKIYRRASSEQRPRTRSCHESERLV